MEKKTLYRDSSLQKLMLRANESKTHGKACFVSDMEEKGMLHGILVRAPYPHCRIKKLDTRAALALEGVEAVLSARDIRGRKVYGKSGVEDQQVLAQEYTYSYFDVEALIAAKTLEQAQNAARFLDVEYEALPAVFDVLEALDENAPRVHAPKSNVAKEYHYSRGDVDAAFQNAYQVVEGTFTLPPIEHCYLETDCALAKVEENGSILVYTGCHGVFTEQEMIAAVLDRPLEEISVVQPYMGGSFGGKDDNMFSTYAAMLAERTGKPVRVLISREEEFVAHTKRRPHIIHAKMGFDADGSIEASSYDIISDNGSTVHYGAAIMKFVALNAPGPYKIRNVDVRARAVYTNNVACGAMRSWGMTSVTFATETLLNMGAEKLGMEPLAIRRINAVQEGDLTLCDSPVPSQPRYHECLGIMGEKALPRLKDDPRGRYVYGVGYAGNAQGCNFHFGHPDVSTVRLDVQSGGKIRICSAASDLGQGLEATLILILSQTLGGYPFEEISYARPATSMPDGGSTGASRQTTMTGNATFRAGMALLEACKTLFAKITGVSAAELRFENGLLEAGEKTKTSLFELLKERGEGLSVEGSFTAPRTSDPDENGRGFPINQYSYGVQRAIVRVDCCTGIVKLLEYRAVHDAGRIVNPIGASAQIEGALAQGCGMALMESFLQKNGRPLQHGFSDYLFPTATDMPEISVDFVNKPVDMGELRVKGLAELGISGPVPAISAAIHDAAGIWITDIPAMPERVLEKLMEAEKNEK